LHSILKLESLYFACKQFIITIRQQNKTAGEFRIFIAVTARNGVTSHVRLSSPLFPPIPVELDGWNLAGIIIILVAQNLPTRFLISCLEATFNNIQQQRALFCNKIQQVYYETNAGGLVFFHAQKIPIYLIIIIVYVSISNLKMHSWKSGTFINKGFTFLFFSSQPIICGDFQQDN